MQCSVTMLRKEAAGDVSLCVWLGMIRWHTKTAKKANAALVEPHGQGNQAYTENKVHRGGGATGERVVGLALVAKSLSTESP